MPNSSPPRDPLTKRCSVRCRCRGRVFVEKESATQVQVEDHQRGCCDDDTVNAVFFPFLCSLCAGDDQEEDLRLESTEIKTKMKTTIFVFGRRSRRRSRRRSHSSSRGAANQQRDDSRPWLLLRHTRIFLFLVCFFFLLSPRHKHTRNFVFLVCLLLLSFFLSCVVCMLLMSTKARANP